MPVRGLAYSGAARIERTALQRCTRELLQGRVRDDVRVVAFERNRKGTYTTGLARAL